MITNFFTTKRKVAEVGGEEGSSGKKQCKEGGVGEETRKNGGDRSVDALGDEAQDMLSGLEKGSWRNALIDRHFASVSFLNLAKFIKRER